MQELNFPLFFHPLPEDEERLILEDNNIKVYNLLLDHSIKCSGFLFEEKKSPRKIIKSELERYDIPFDKINSIKNGADWISLQGDIISNDAITTKNTLPYRYAFCSDTRYKESLIQKIKGVNLLYHETTFMQDLEERAKKTGHSTTLQAATIAKKADVKRLLIGHYSQRYKDLNTLLNETQEVFPDSHLTYPGMLVDLQKI